MEALRWIEPIVGEFGECRVRFTVDSAWSYGWSIVAWPSSIRVCVRRKDGETMDDVNPDLVEVADV